MADLLIAVAVLGAGLAAAGWLAHRLGLPPALGYLAAGLVTSPVALLSGGLPPGLLHDASRLGVLFVLFLIGLELDLKRLREALSSTALTLPFDLLVPALAAFLLGRLAGWSLVESAALGLAGCLSSTIFGERLVTGHAMADARKRALGVLLAEDTMAGGLLAVVAILGGAAGGLLGPVATVARLLFLFILLAGIALLVMPSLLDAVARRHANELLVLTGGGLVVAFGAAGAWAGSAELGALVAGVAAAEAGSRFVLRNAVQSVRDIGLALFFFTSGLLVDLHAVGTTPLVLGVALAMVFLATKLLVHVPAALGRGLSLDHALRAALALGTLGEFSLILVAAAQSDGVANVELRPTIIAAMVVLLVATPILAGRSAKLAGLVRGLPSGVLDPVRRVVQGVSAPPPEGGTASARRTAGFLLTANLILLVAWGLLAAWAGRWVVEHIPTPRNLFLPILVFGFAVAVAAPLVLRAYRAYRDLVWLLVGLQPGEPSRAGRVRARLVDAWVAATVALILVPIALIVPSTLPVLAGGLVVAVSIVAIAWRQLSGFQRTLEGSITRVLGHDARAAAMLDQVLRKYPWGVRFAAGTVAADSPLAGRSLLESRIHELSGALVAVHERQGTETVSPGPETRLMPGDTVVLMGEADELAKAEALLVAHGEALRATVQSRLAEVVEVPVHAGSPLLGKSLGESDLRGATGALVVGLWPHGARHPLPYRPDLVLQAEDHLILLGAPLQVERARSLAAGDE